jgi:hypothetical protein
MTAILDAPTPNGCGLTDFELETERDFATASVRCSSLPLVAQCAAALVKPAITIEADRGPADLGSAFHACMAAFVKSGTPPVITIPDEASRWNVEAGELAPLVWWATKAWTEQLAVLYPNAQVEVALEAIDAEIGLTLTGHIDLMSWVPEALEVRILDYKSGWIDADARQQLRGYGLLAILKYPDAKQVRISKLQVREGRIDTEVLTRDEITNWWVWLADHTAERETYRAGEHCERCPRRLECNARLAEVKNTVKWITELANTSEHGTIELIEMDADTMTTLLLAARAMAKTLDRVIGSIRSEVSMRGEGGYGRMHLKEQNRETIDLGRAYPILVEAIGADTLIPLMKVSKKDVSQAIMANSPRGRKGPAVASVMEKLVEAGAINTKPTFILEVRSNGSSTEKQLPSAGDTDGNAEPESATGGV